MTAKAKAAPAAKHELVLTRLIDAPRDKLFRCWTEPELLKQWFAPLPYTVPHAELDVRTGGANYIVMKSTEGEDMQMRGVYIELVKNEKICLPGAYNRAGQPSDKTILNATATFDVAKHETE